MKKTDSSKEISSFAIGIIKIIEVILFILMSILLIKMTWWAVPFSYLYFLGRGTGAIFVNHQGIYDYYMKYFNNKSDGNNPHLVSFEKLQPEIVLSEIEQKIKDRNELTLEK